MGSPRSRQRARRRYGGGGGGVWRVTGRPTNSRGGAAAPRAAGRGLLRVSAERRARAAGRGHRGGGAGRWRCPGRGARLPPPPGRRLRTRRSRPAGARAVGLGWACGVTLPGVMTGGEGAWEPGYRARRPPSPPPGGWDGQRQHHSTPTGRGALRRRPAPGARRQHGVRRPRCARRCGAPAHPRPRPTRTRIGRRRAPGHLYASQHHNERAHGRGEGAPAPPSRPRATPRGAGAAWTGRAARTALGCLKVRLPRRQEEWATREAAAALRAARCAPLAAPRCPAPPRPWHLRTRPPPTTRGPLVAARPRVAAAAAVVAAAAPAPPARPACEQQQRRTPRRRGPPPPAAAAAGAAAAAASAGGALSLPALLHAVGVFILCCAGAAFLLAAIPALWAAARAAHRAEAVLRVGAGAPGPWVGPGPGRTPRL
jgi:hypothetical protein